MATQPIDIRPTPVPAPDWLASYHRNKPTVSVAFVAGEAARAVDAVMADLPAETRDSTLDELAASDGVGQVIALTVELVTTARSLLSPPMYGAFLRWGDSAVRFTTQLDTDDEVNAHYVRHCEVVDALSETKATTQSDMCFKAYVAAVEGQDRGGAVGPIDIANRPDWPFPGGALSAGFVADILEMSPISSQLNEIAARAWTMSKFGSAWTREIGLPIATLFASAGANSSRFEAMRLKWLALQTCTDVICNDEDPRFGAMNDSLMEIERQMARDPSCCVADASAKLRFATDTDRVGVPLDGQELHLIISDVARYMPHEVGAVAANDTAINKAFAARRRDFEANFDSDMTHEEEQAYEARLDTYEGILSETPATSIEAVIAKMRIAFMHQTGSAWADRAIMDPTHPDFVAGLAGAGMYTRMTWAAIEDLARIGGVNLAEQGK